MPIQKLSRQELSSRPSGRGGNTEYIHFIGSLKIGEGGKAVVAEEGVSRQSVKKHLTDAAQASGVAIKFVPSSSEEVWFQVVEAGAERPRRGRPPKTA